VQLLTLFVKRGCCRGWKRGSSSTSETSSSANYMYLYQSQLFDNITHLTSLPLELHLTTSQLWFGQEQEEILS